MVVNPVEREGLRVATPRRATRSASRARACSPATAVRGHLHEARITVLDGSERARRATSTSTSTTARAVPTPEPATKATSLATPLGMAVTSDGATLYVAAFGSSKVGVFDTARARGRHLRARRARDHIAVSGGGPSGLVLDEARAPALRADPLRRRRLGRSTPRPRREIAQHRRCTTRSRPSVVERPAASSTTRRSRRATARRRARAATSSATSTAWRGTSATPTTSC